MPSLALKNALKYFRILDNELVIGNRRISEIAVQNRTPFYIYDLSVARKKVERLRAALPEEIDIHYAIKANPHSKIIAFFNKLGLGFDVASMGELKTALKVGVAAKHCGFAGPGKSREEIEFAISQGIGSLNMESEAELDLANEIAGRLGRKAHIALRLNLPFALKRSGMQMNGGPSAFGIDVEKIPDLLRKLPGLPNIVFKGFHIFAGAQNLAAAALIQYFGKTFDLLRELRTYCPEPISMINLGGGFGIPYFQNDEELDIESIGSVLTKLLDENRSYFPDTKFIIETGRYLIGECGVYVTRVRYKKQSRGKVFLIVEGGLNHHLAATGNFGQVVRKNFPIAALTKFGRSAMEKYHIAGPLCTPLDILGTDVELPVMEEGDLIGVFASGAYGLTASPLRFLSHTEPGEIVVE